MHVNYQVKTNDSWVMGVEALFPPEKAYVMADALHVISNDEDIYSLGTNVHSAVSNDD